MWHLNDKGVLTSQEFALVTVAINRSETLTFAFQVDPWGPQKALELRLGLGAGGVSVGEISDAASRNDDCRRAQRIAFAKIYPLVEVDTLRECLAVELTLERQRSKEMQRVKFNFRGTPHVEHTGYIHD